MEDLLPLLLLPFVAGSFINGIWVLVIAFRESTQQGLLYIFVPFYGLYYIFSRWSKCRKPFKFVLVGFIISSLGIAILSVVYGLRKDKLQEAKIDIGQIALALDRYAVDNGQYPTTEQGLDALIRKPTSPPVPMNWTTRYVDPTDFMDPWQAVYIYESPSTHEGYDYDLYSLGADGQEGGEGENKDITSWFEEDEF